MLRTHLRANLLLLGLTVLLCSVLYPLVLWGVGQTLFPSNADGSLITAKGPDGKERVVGSRLIAQPFTGDEYIWPRPSAASYNATASGASNYGANNPKLRGRVAQDVGRIVRYRDGRAAADDVEAWFRAGGEDRSKGRARRDLVAEWFADNPTLTKVWAKSSPAVEEYVRKFPGVEAAWRAKNPGQEFTADAAKTEDLVTDHFAGLFAAKHPGRWPCKGTEKKDGKDVDVVRELDEGKGIGSTDIAAVFFDTWLRDNPEKLPDLVPVPADLVMTSGSGLDPHVTLRNALSVYQLDRVAAKRQANRDQVKRLLEERSFAPLGGLVGEPLVNVLEVNLALDEKFPLPPGR
jgi:K+-transporting ATPase ATPase C chain